LPFHRELAGSTLAVVAEAGHMVHYAAPDDVVAAGKRFQMAHLESTMEAA
jgi:pimeloyl-ACP methyl ester carboxylesterase